MVDPRGILTLSVGDTEYRLHLGFSALAEVQAKHGKAFDDLVSGRFEGEVPPIAVIHALFTAALRRFHREVAADPFLVDDIIAANPNALGDLMTASSPDAVSGAEGNGKTAA
jgi:hypothetical protein